MSAYATDGSLNVRVVDGASYTGRLATDGSTYVVQNDGSTYTGVNHVCGAVNVVVAAAGGQMQHANGSLLVKASPYLSGTQKVTVVSGAFV